MASHHMAPAHHSFIPAGKVGQLFRGIIEHFIDVLLRLGKSPTDEMEVVMCLISTNQQ